MRVRLGPCNDAPDLIPTVRQAVARLPIYRLLADGAYDAETNHRVCRSELGIASTIIPANLRGFPDQEPKGPYRRMMHRRFPHRKYGQRWQAESVISRFKRRLGAALSARSTEARERECAYRVLTHNLAIIHLLVVKGFYRAL